MSKPPRPSSIAPIEGLLAGYGDKVYKLALYTLSLESYISTLEFSDHPKCVAGVGHTWDQWVQNRAQEYATAMSPQYSSECLTYGCDVIRYAHDLQPVGDLQYGRNLHPIKDDEK